MAGELEPSPGVAASGDHPGAAPPGCAEQDDDRHRQAGPGKPAKPRRPLWRDILVIGAVALVLTLVLKSVVLEVFSIPSQSMDNTIAPGDRVLVNKLVYHLRGIARGDVVVFNGDGSWNPPAQVPGSPAGRLLRDVLSRLGLESDGVDYIKRVIGLPGDRVACCDAQGRMTVNGVPLAERSYLFPGDPPSLVRFSVKVPPGRLWVMGDNRSDSADSRSHRNAPGGGTIPESAVVGRAFLIVWPVSRIRDLPIPATFARPALKVAGHGG